MKQALFWILSAISLSIYIGLAYYTERPEFQKIVVQVSALYMLLFATWNLMRHRLFEFYPVRSILWAGILLRLSLFFSLPNFSDDYFRFIWDGELIIHGLNPFASIPSDVISQFTDDVHLNSIYQGLNSKNYFSVYPPLNQYIFGISALLSGGNVMAAVMLMKLFIFLAELMTMIMLPGLFAKLKLNPALAVFYILNPLVILEGMGNLHFEPLTICFLVFSIKYLLDEKLLRSALFFALAVSVKLVPFILLPIIFRYLGIQKATKYGALIVLVFGALFIPFLEGSMFQHIFSSLELYYQRFEFNASIYYIMREIGFMVKGYNIIHAAGIVLIILFLMACFFISKQVQRGSRSNLVSWSFWLFVAFYFLSTTVHPWYLINVLLFGLLAGYYRSAVFWTGLCFLSYSTYISPGNSENLFLIAFEYLAFLLILMHEHRQMATFKMNIDQSNL